MESVMDVVIPLGDVVLRTAVGIPRQKARVVQVVLQHQMNVALAAGTALDRAGKLGEDVEFDSSWMAWTASRRRPSTWNSSSQYNALCMKKSRTTRLSGPSKLMAAPHGV